MSDALRPFLYTNPILASSIGSVLLFHGAGAGPPMFTATNVDKKPVPNSLATFCKENFINFIVPNMTNEAIVKDYGPVRRDAERSAVLAPDSWPVYRYNGAVAEKHKVIKLSQTYLAFAVGALIDRLRKTNFFNNWYVLGGHSMGTSMSYEFCRQCLERRLPLPLGVFVSSMGSPSIRTWPRVDELSDDEFKTEVRKWGMSNDALGKYWSVFGPTSRRDMDYLNRYCDSWCVHFNITPIIELKPEQMDRPDLVDTQEKENTNDNRVVPASVMIRVLVGRNDHYIKLAHVYTLNQMFQAANTEIVTVLDDCDHDILYSLAGRAKWLNGMKEFLEECADYNPEMGI